MDCPITQNIEPNGRFQPIGINNKKIRYSTPIKLKLLGVFFNIAHRVSPNWASDKLSQLWFYVFKPSRKPWVHRFWQLADQSVELSVGDKNVVIYLWGTGPLIVCQHGWSGSGTQFKNIVPELVTAGFRVAVFDAPAHGYNEGHSTTVMEIADTLLAIQNTIAPVHAVIAHSIGAMSSLHAIREGLRCNKLILLNPGVNLNDIFTAYNKILRFGDKLKQEFRLKVTTKMQNKLQGEDPWKIFSTSELFAGDKISGLLIYDTDDSELPLHQFLEVKRYWNPEQTLVTNGLGHNGILKESKVIQSMVKYLVGTPGSCSE